MIVLDHPIFLLACAAVGTVAGPVISRDASASATSIAPAATTVSTDSPAGVSLFEAEAVQLTEGVLNDIKVSTNATEILALVGFGNDTNLDVATLSRRTRSCKTFPGDWNYPKSLLWSGLDLLLGGALIKTTPVAAPCYKSSGVYDEAKCADISARFTTADLQ